MKIVHVKRVEMNPALRAVPRSAKIATLHAIPVSTKMMEEPPAARPSVEESANLLPKVQALCEKSTSICDQMGRLMNMGEDEFDRDKAIGLYQRVAVLRASGIVLYAKLEESDIGDESASDVVAHIAKQAKQMMKDLEDRLKNG